MKVLGFDIDDIVVKEFYRHVSGKECFEFLEMQVASAIHTELGISSPGNHQKLVEEALSIYGREECELHIYKVLNEMIGDLYTVLSYYFEPIAIYKTPVIKYFGHEPSEKELAEIQSLIDQTISDLGYQNINEMIQKKGLAPALYEVEDKVETTLQKWTARRENATFRSPESEAKNKP